MNHLGPELATESLLFSWDSPRTKKAALLAFLAISLLAHAVCFYIFQVVYPPTVTLVPPPARVALITSASEEGRTLLRWIDAEDPAVAFTTHRPPEARLRALPKVEHVPSYHAMEPTLKELPPFTSIRVRPTLNRRARHRLCANKARLMVSRSQHLFRFHPSSKAWELRHCRHSSSSLQPENRLKRFVFVWQ
jgi:hypothetical protein